MGSETEGTCPEFALEFPLHQIVLSTTCFWFFWWSAAFAWNLEVGDILLPFLIRICLLRSVLLEDCYLEEIYGNLLCLFCCSLQSLFNH